MNTSGQAVGYSLTAEGRRHAFSWTRDGGGAITIHASKN